MTSTGTDRARGLLSFLLLAWTDLLNSNRLLVHLCQWKAVLSRLMVATQQVGEKMTWGLFHKEGLTQVWLAESGGYNLYQKLPWLILSYKLFSSKHDFEITTESTVVVRPIRRPTNRTSGAWARASVGQARQESSTHSTYQFLHPAQHLQQQHIRRSTYHPRCWRYR
jgi:hypothetical protein